MNSPQLKLPPVNRLSRQSESPELIKVKRIHNIHMQDWNKLQRKIKYRNLSMKSSEDSSFMRDMWAFRDYTKDTFRSIQDTSMFKIRKEDTIKKKLKQRFEHFFRPLNLREAEDSKHKPTRSSMN